MAATETNNGIDRLNGGKPTELQLRAFANFLGSFGVQPTRQDLTYLWSQTFGGDRDFFTAFGYERVLRYPNYKARYDRGGIAGRIVDVPPQYTWRSPPTILDNGKTTTRFGRDWRSLNERIRCFYNLEKADRLSRIGRFAIAIIGTERGGSLAAPLPQMTGPDQVTYLSCFSEGHASVAKVETNPSSPRFGKPFTYEVDLTRGLSGAMGLTGDQVTQLASLGQQQVHWTRVIHAAEALGEDEIFAAPALERVWNLLDDQDKASGAAAESFWRTADRGMQIDVDRDINWNPEDKADLENQIAEWVNGFRRIFRTRGVKMQAFSSEAVNPRGVHAVVSSLVVGTTGIPLRLLYGPERGQFSLPEERAGFLQLISDRRTGYAEPNLLRQLIDRLIDHGALHKPRNPKGYQVLWEDLLVPNELEQSEIARNYSTAAANFAKQAQLGQNVVPPDEARKYFRGVDPSRPWPTVEDEGDTTQEDVDDATPDTTQGGADE